MVGLVQRDLEPAYLEHAGIWFETLHLRNDQTRCEQ